MKLSERLQCIANEINMGETMADVGTDHGFLPLYLLEKEICPKVIMTDISKGSLAKAEENCNEFLPGGNYELRLGNGIEVLSKGEVDDIVIAGMGGILISDIIGDDLEKSKSVKRFILQPRNNIGFLRYFLLNSGFIITNEQLAREGRFIWEIITAENEKRNNGTISSANMEFDKNSVEYEFPKSLIDFANSLSIPFLENKIKIERTIKEHYSKAKNQSQKKYDEIKYRINYLEDLKREIALKLEVK